MQDLSNIVEVDELTDKEQVNALIKEGSPWRLIAVAPGQYADKRAYHLYCVGREYRAPEPEWVN